MKNLGERNQHLDEAAVGEAQRYVMKVVVRTMGWGFVLAVVALYSFLGVRGGVGLYRLVPVQNDPLTNSVAVTSISSNKLTLADGRVLVMLDYSSEDLKQEMRDAEGRVELDSDESRFASVYVKQKTFICGTYAPTIVIPLFRSKYPAYSRHPLGLAQFQ